jgi:hypothetical protein
MQVRYFTCIFIYSKEIIIKFTVILFPRRKHNIPVIYRAMIALYI